MVPTISIKAPLLGLPDLGSMSHRIRLVSEKVSLWAYTYTGNGQQVPLVKRRRKDYTFV